MAYTNPWNNSLPVGTDPADDLDLFIRNLKVDITDRMDDLIGTGNWANDGVDPKTMAEGTARATVDILSNRPANPTEEGELFFAEDTGVLYIGDSGLNWAIAGGAAEWVTFGATQAIINSEGIARLISVIIPVTVSAALGVPGQFTIDMVAYDATFVGADVKMLIGFGGVSGQTVSPRPVASAGTSFDCVMLNEDGTAAGDGLNTVTGSITVDL